MAAEYDTSKEYEISGIKVISEIVKDEDNPDFRALVIRSSCPSTRWGTRTQDHSLTHYKSGSADFATTLEQIRKQAAETLVKTERGELPERSLSFLGIEIDGPTGKKINVIAAPDLSRGPSLLDKGMIDALELQLDGTHFYQEAAGQTRRIPLYKAKMTFGGISVETSVAPSNHGSPALILGGDFFQKAMRGKEGEIQELVLPDHRRALANAARCQKAHVLIAGKYGGKYRERLDRIKQALNSKNFTGLILDEYPDIEEQSLPAKMALFGSICRFVVVDDLVASGHNVELEICHERKFVTAILRQHAAASTAMQDDITEEVTFIRGFDYGADSEIENTVIKAAEWADEFVKRRARRLNRKYSQWRGPNKVM